MVNDEAYFSEQQVDDVLSQRPLEEVLAVLSKKYNWHKERKNGKSIIVLHYEAKSIYELSYLLGKRGCLDEVYGTDGLYYEWVRSEESK